MSGSTPSGASVFCRASNAIFFAFWRVLLASATLVGAALCITMWVTCRSMSATACSMSPTVRPVGVTGRRWCSSVVGSAGIWAASCSVWVIGWLERGDGDPDAATPLICWASAWPGRGSSEEKGIT